MADAVAAPMRSTICCKVALMSGGADVDRLVMPTLTAASCVSIMSRPGSASKGAIGRSRTAATICSRSSASRGKSDPMPPTSAT